eukprot:264763_1
MEEREKHKLKSDITNLKNVAKKLLKQKQKCESEIGSLKENIANYEIKTERLNDLQLSYDNLSEMTSHLKKELDSTKSLLVKKNAEFNQKVQEIVHLKQQIQKSRENIDNLNTAKSSFTQIISEWKDKYDLATKNNKLQMQAKDKEINDLRMKYNEVKDKYTMLSNELNAMKQQDVCDSSASELQNKLKRNFEFLLSTTQTYNSTLKQKHEAINHNTKVKTANIYKYLGSTFLILGCFAIGSVYVHVKKTNRQQ